MYSILVVCCNFLFNLFFFLFWVAECWLKWQKYMNLDGSLAILYTSAFPHWSNLILYIVLLYLSNWSLLHKIAFILLLLLLLFCLGWIRDGIMSLFSKGCVLVVYTRRKLNSLNSFLLWKKTAFDHFFFPHHCKVRNLEEKLLKSSEKNKFSQMAKEQFHLYFHYYIFAFINWNFWFFHHKLLELRLFSFCIENFLN